MRPLAIFAAIALCLGVAACGGTGKTGTTQSSTTRASHHAASAAVTGRTAVHAPPVRLAHTLPRADGDGDNPHDIDSTGDPDIGDGDDDRPIPAGFRFPDPDDAFTLHYGKAVGAAEARKIAGIVVHYFQAARANDAVTACEMMLPELAESVTVGRPPRPAGETCQTVMSALFARHRRELAARVGVFSVRDEYGRVQVVLGSKTLPASLVYLKREGGSWMLGSVLGMPVS